MNVSAIILAGGSSTRMKNIDKQTMMLNGLPVIIYSIKTFCEIEEVREIILCVSKKNQKQIVELLNNYTFGKKIKVVLGGKSRQYSVFNAVSQVSSDCNYVAIHDGARPFVKKNDIEKTIENAKKYGGSALFSSCKDTVKIGKDNYIEKTLNRDEIYFAQTPQVFLFDAYKKAIEQAILQGADFTDDCAVFENAGQRVYITLGSSENIKITSVEDLKFAEFTARKEQKEMRIGHGYDVHKLVENRDLILGGEKIPYFKGLEGHSDADVLIHAIIDALLGGLAIGDIGKMFPDTDDKYKDANSVKLLEKAYEKVLEKGYIISNLDSTIVAQEPKLAPFIVKMRENIANALKTEIDNISVKATTEEKLGFTGKKLGISATCVCLLKKI